MAKKELKKPFIGAAYYPEDWPESKMDYDISKMKEFGISVVEQNGRYYIIFAANNIHEDGENSVRYAHENMSYALNLTCKVSAEENGYRISPDGNSFELSFVRFGKKA